MFGGEIELNFLDQQGHGYGTLKYCSHQRVFGKEATGGTLLTTVCRVIGGSGVTLPNCNRHNGKEEDQRKENEQAISKVLSRSFGVHDGAELVKGKHGKLAKSKFQVIDNCRMAPSNYGTPTAQPHEAGRSFASISNFADCLAYQTFRGNKRRDK